MEDQIVPYFTKSEIELKSELMVDIEENNICLLIMNPDDCMGGKIIIDKKQAKKLQIY